MIIDCRSALYMPASNERALAKGPTLAADAIIVDLEDSVAPDHKVLARARAVSALGGYNYDYRHRVLRINSAHTTWYTDDIEALAQCKPDAVVLPKVESVEHVQMLSSAMDKYDSLGQCEIWAMIESPLGVLNAAAIAASSQQYKRLSMLIVGNNDLARQAGMAVTAKRELLVPWIMTLIAASKAYGLQILDGVYNNHTDTDGFTAECQQAASMGMDGKTLIHPSQLAISNRVFSPSNEEVEQAEQIVAAFSLPEHVDKGVISINGQMTERLHLEMAKQVLQRVERLSRRT